MQSVLEYTKFNSQVKRESLFAFHNKIFYSHFHYYCMLLKTRIHRFRAQKSLVGNAPYGTA